MDGSSPRELFVDKSMTSEDRNDRVVLVTILAHEVTEKRSPWAMFTMCGDSPYEIWDKQENRLE